MTISALIEALEELQRQYGGEASVLIEADHGIFEPEILGVDFDPATGSPLCIIGAE